MATKLKGDFAQKLRRKGFKVRPYRMKRLKPYYDRMSKDDLNQVYDDNIADMLRAQGYAISQSPRSVYRVAKLYEALSGYAPRITHAPQPGKSLTMGIALARRCYAKPHDRHHLRVLPFTPETVVKVTSNPSGSAGVTAYGKSKAESQVRALERGLQTLRGEKQPEPCLGFKRTQFNDKTRLVWGYPYSMTIVEGLVAYSLIQEFKGGTTPMAFAMSTMTLGTKLRVAAYHYKWAYSLDMSQFDATISSQLIHYAFQILRTWYDKDEIEPVSGKTVGEIFNLIEYYFVHTTIVMPDGHIYIGKDHGVPSGSFFTQIVDSIVNTILAGYLSCEFDLHVDKNSILVLGDDLLFWSNRKVSLDELSRVAQAKLGIKLHGSEKSELTRYDQPVRFLGRVWTNGVPDLDEEEIIKRMVWPERFRRYSPDYKTRQREIKLLLLSYASVYRHGWSIASTTLGCGQTRDRDCAAAIMLDL